MGSGAPAAVGLAPMEPSHWPAVRVIYEDGIATGEATFETSVPAWEVWDATHHTVCRLVAFDGPTVIGWAALAPVSHRAVYRGVAEVSVYIAASARGRGVGRRLLEALVTESERHGFWTLQSTVFPENGASVTLHQRCGFRIVGTRERIGRRDGRWRDVVLLERRSAGGG